MHLKLHDLILLSYIEEHKDPSFTEIKDALCLSDGCLSIKLKQVERHGYVIRTNAMSKEHRRITRFSITEEGSEYIMQLLKSLRHVPYMSEFSKYFYTKLSL